jgi:2-methylcitrate dehydratase PrpD
MSITDKYINSLYELMQVEFPDPIISHAKKCLLDYLGVTFAGAAMLREKANRFLNYSENHNNDIAVIGFNRKSNLYNAALVNGMSAHIAELDDGVRQGSIHLGAPIISALLPVAQQYQLSGNDLLRGIIIGYEAAIRLASAIQPSHRNKGYHVTGTCGTIGVALGTGSALRFSQQQMKNALSAAATSSSGMLNVTKGASELKPYNAGQAAVSGLIAALIARAGFNGAVDVLAGEWGFINMMTEKSKLSLLETGFEGKWGIEKVYMKPYAACRHCHPAIEAALILKQQHDIDFLEQISKVNVFTYHSATTGHDHTEVYGITDAKMSTPYSIAVALVTGKAGIEAYSEEMIHNNQIMELAKKIKVISDDSIDALVPEKRPATVEIIMHNQKQFSLRIDLAKGEPENPIMVEDMNEKFNSLAMYGGKTSEECMKLQNCIWSIENNISMLFNFF